MPFLLLFFLWQPAPVACADVVECRRLATEAAARGDYEAFHDLAWRAVQKGKRNDADLMMMLARAQALSGRPGDALVMLTRVADLGSRPDVSTDPDFARVRALSGWPELEAKLTGNPPAAAQPGVSGAASSPSAPSAAPGHPSAASPNPPAPGVASSAAPSASATSGMLSFSAPGVEPFALAHDAVSRRFVLGDRKAHRLLVIDDVSRNVVNYVSAATAGFYEQLTALAIDPRRGDLWVASAKAQGADTASVLHKLQLVSGRMLAEAHLPDRAGAVRLVGVAVTSDGTVYALDAITPRLFRLRPGAHVMEQVMRIEAPGASAIAAVDDRMLYVAGEQGLIRVDVGARAATPVKSADPIGGLESMWWRGDLFGVQRVEDASRVVRIKLDAAGTRVTARQVLASAPAGAVGTLAGDSFYYLSDDATIRRLDLRR